MQLLVWLMHLQLHVLNGFIFQFSLVWTLVSKGTGFHAQGPCRQMTPQHVEGDGDSL